MRDEFNETVLIGSLLTLCAYFGFKLYKLQLTFQNSFTDNDLEPQAKPTQKTIIIQKEKPKRKPKQRYEPNQMSNPALPRRGRKTFKTRTQHLHPHDNASGS